MARGRPRKKGERYPSGKIKPVAKTSYWQRELDELRKGSRDHRLGSQLGILWRSDVITQNAFDAGMRFADARKAADGALGLPPRDAPAQDINAVHGASNAVDTPESAARKARAIAAYDAAEEAVGLNSLPLRALQWVVIYERRPDDYEQLLALFTGLQKLMSHYRMPGQVRPQERAA